MNEIFDNIVFLCGVMVFGIIDGVFMVFCIVFRSVRLVKM